MLRKPPIFVRKLLEQEREALETVLRSSDAFVLRRCQVLLVSAGDECRPQVVENRGCGQQRLRNAIHDFIEHGLGALQAGSSRPREVHAAFDESGANEMASSSIRASSSLRPGALGIKAELTPDAFMQDRDEAAVAGR